jgi:hypothetical protein
MATTKSSASRARARTARPVEPPVAEPVKQTRAPAANRPPGKEAVAVAEYIASMTTELAAMAGAARLDMLTYFLNMARLEAEYHKRQHE